MAFDGTLPLDDGYLAEAPGQLREQFRALKDDKIINAGKLKGLEPGNASGNVPINNGTLNTDLNADKLDGHDSAYFSASTHTHAAATTNAAGLMSAADKVKLNGIAAGAEVNQNTFAKVKVGSVVVEADQKQDTLELVAGSNIIITPDTANDKLTIALPSTISANTSGDAATCNGCGRVAPTELTDDNAMSHLESGFYRTDGNATAGGAGGCKYSAIIQTMRGQTRGGRIIFSVWSDNTKPDVRAQAFNGEWGPLNSFVLQGDTFTGTVNGNADSATKLQTSRRINGVLFNGTGDITITAAANGGTSAACSGNAATATRLSPGAKINGVNFNGTGNITIPTQEYAAVSKTTAGYIKFKSSGIILQWCRSSQLNEYQETAVTFPIAFPTACAICVGGTAEFIRGAASQVVVKSWTKTTCIAQGGAGGGGQMRTVTIIAIGY